MNKDRWPIGYELMYHRPSDFGKYCEPWLKSNGFENTPKSKCMACLDFLDWVKAKKEQSPESDHLRSIDVRARAALDFEWCETGMPYYKITSGLVDALMRTKLDVQVRDFRAPVPTFEIRLPESRWIPFSIGEKTREALLAQAPDPNGEYWITGGLFSVISVDQARKLEAKLTSLACNGWHDDTPIMINSQVVIARNRKYDGVATMRMSFHSEDQSLEDFTSIHVVNEIGDKDDTLVEEATKRFVPKLVHLMVGTCLLATSKDAAELLMPDILRKDEPRWNASGPEERQVMGERARRRRGMIGFRVGEQVIPRRSTSSGSGEPTGKHLHSAHWRCGHFRVVRFGEGRRQRHVRWIKPTIVRPDLPMKESQKRYRVSE